MKTTTINIDSLENDRFERSKRFGWFNINKIMRTNILVVGAGATGNEVCKNLALSGFKYISIIDMDYIAKSNLNRCLFFNEYDAEKKKMKSEVIKEKLIQLNPDIKVRSYVDRVENMDEDFISSFDVVLGCLDNISTRLHVNAHCYYNKIPYIDSGTNGLIGKVQVILPPETSCLECGINKTHRKIKEMRLSCTGRDVTFYEQKIANEINTTSIISAVQVLELVKIVHKQWDHIIRNMFYFDGNRNISEILEIPINQSCYHHKKTSQIDNIKKNERRQACK